MIVPCHHKPSVYDDGAPVIFLVPRLRKNDTRHISASMHLCIKCTTLYLEPSREEKKAWGVE
jgi:hypothetical protein